jgi:hypothetical protein
VRAANILFKIGVNSVRAVLAMGVEFSTKAVVARVLAREPKESNDERRDGAGYWPVLAGCDCAAAWVDG